MCKILPIDQLNFENATWTFHLDKIKYQLNHGSFSAEMLQPFLYTKNKDLNNAYTLFGTGLISESADPPLTKDYYCILLKNIENKKRAFLVHSTDFYHEFIPGPFPFSL
jgi:hypothetical protein